MYLSGVVRPSYRKRQFFTTVLALAASGTLLAACTAGSGQTQAASGESAAPTDAAPRACSRFTGNIEPGPFPDGVGAYEGWWNSLPAAEDGSLLEPDEWDGPEAEHPSVALVRADSGEVIASYSRFTCGPVEGTVAVSGEEDEPGTILVVDAETGQIVETFTEPSP